MTERDEAKTPGWWHRWRARLALAVIASIALHVSMGVGWLVASGRAGGDVLGENGVRGAGGPELEISVVDEPSEQPAAAPLAPPAPLQPAMPPAPPPKPAAKAPPPPPKRPVMTSDEKDPAGAPKVEKSIPETKDAAKLAQKDDEERVEEPPEPPRPPPLRGSGLLIESDPTPDERLGPRSSGKAAGDANSITAQRGRLSAAAECDDPVQGVWVASFYDASRLSWYVFTLNMRRNGDVLNGSISSHFWEGFSRQTSPPPCELGGMENYVSMTGVGRVSGSHVYFGGMNWHLSRRVCGSGMIGYSDDNFSGTIDPQRHEFQSLANDGGDMVNQPAVFRRTACLK